MVQMCWTSQIRTESVVWKESKDGKNIAPGIFKYFSRLKLDES